MMTSSHESHVMGQSDHAWNMPTILDFDASSAEAHTEQWLDLVDWTPDAGRRRQTRPAEASESCAGHSAAVLAPPPAEPVAAHDSAESPLAAESSPNVEAIVKVESNESVASTESVEPPVAAGPDLDCPSQDVSVATAVPGEQAVMVAGDTSLADLQYLALQPWPANRSIEPYLSRVEALQLALVIARLESTQGEELRRREQRRLRRTLGLVAVGSAVSVLVLALVSRFDTPARIERVEPVPVVSQEPVVSPIGASVRFVPETVPDVPTHADEAAGARTPKPQAVARKPAHRK